MMTEDPVWRLSNGLHGPTYLRRRRGRLLATSAAAGLLWGTAAVADPEPQTINGVPQQIIPQVGEVGLPAFTFPTGTVSSGSGTTGTGTMNGGTGTSTDSSALDTMNATSWGAAASQNAQALGVNASALAATCVMESGCQNLGGPGSAGNITGAFQMMASTYQSSMAAALQQDPSLASNIVPGLAGQNDPATQAIAAAEFLRQDALQLQAAGISNPTALDVRGSYNFGGVNGVAIANADPSTPMATVLQSMSASTLAQNGITPGETVGQWKSAVSAKMGSAASAPVLIS
jgi:hypothetical protein